MNKRKPRNCSAIFYQTDKFQSPIYWGTLITRFNDPNWNRSIYSHIILNLLNHFACNANPFRGIHRANKFHVEIRKKLTLIPLGLRDFRLGVFTLEWSHFQRAEFFHKFHTNLIMEFSADIHIERDLLAIQTDNGDKKRKVLKRVRERIFSIRFFFKTNDGMLKKSNR